jgi:hypothetical protein
MDSRHSMASSSAGLRGSHEKNDITVSTTEVPYDQQRDNAAEDAKNKHNSTNFFPWIQYPHDKIQLKKASFPVKGFIGLVGAILTVLCSWGLLFASNNTQQWEERYPRVAKVLQPTSILSAIISANGILLHMAFSDGMAIAWWLRASKEKATLGDLHQTWVTSSSALGAVQAGKRFNYIALATIVIATIPINGILLQGALGVKSHFVSTGSVNVTIPFAKTFDPAFSGSLRPDGTLNVIDASFSGEAYNYFAGDNKGYIVMYSNNTSDDTVDFDTNNYETGCKDTCIFDVPGLGLYLSCDASDAPPYNFTVDTSQPGWEDLPIVKQGLPIYSSDFAWSVSDPNMIQFNMTAKETYNCSGEYYRIACTLRPRHTMYNATLQRNNSGLAGDTTLSLDPNSDYTDDVYGDYVPANNELATHSTQFGFFARIFSDYFGSTISVQYTNESGSPEYVLGQSGIFANAPWVVYGKNGHTNTGDTVNLTAHGAQGCEVWIDYLRDPLHNDLAVIMGSIRNFMFHLSYEYALQNYYPSKYAQLTAQAFETQNLYQITWWHWGASLGVTLLIVVCVTPTFWGFWALSRVPTMSPLETARAFDAPVLADQKPEMATEELLRVVHARTLHDVVGSGSSL